MLEPFSRSLAPSRPVRRAFGLGIHRTVQYHFDSIRSKLGAANRQEAVALAVRDGVIGPG